MEVINTRWLETVAESWFFLFLYDSCVPHDFIFYDKLKSKLQNIISVNFYEPKLSTFIFYRDIPIVDF